MKRIIFNLLTIILIEIGMTPISGIAFTSNNQAQAAGMSPSLDWPTIAILPYASGFQSPVQVTNAGDGSDRLFVVEQQGRIKILVNQQTLPVPFLDITDRVLFSGEQGLLSVAFPPDYASLGHCYVYYTNKNGDNQVSRFRLMPGDANQLDPDSEELVLYLHHPINANHNGGQLAFSPNDGYLYIGTGDGGGGGDPAGNAQNPDSLLGKMLRIDVEASPSSFTYTIPVSNPFTQTVGYRGEIWALGLRNPWRYSFDRLTGDLYIGDVGQGSYEEVDFQPADSAGGENYGWNVMEGSHCYNASTCNQTGLTLPVLDYTRLANFSAAVAGGVVYRGSISPELQGIYFFADSYDGRLWGLRQNGNQWEHVVLKNTGLYGGIVSFGEDESGEVYFTDLGGGRIFHLTAISSQIAGYLPLVIR